MKVIIETKLGNGSLGNGVKKFVYDNVLKVENVEFVRSDLAKITIIFKNGGKFIVSGLISAVVEDDQPVDAVNNHEEWFGVTRWCRTDIEGRLIDNGCITEKDLEIPEVVDLIDDIVDQCKHHGFTDSMISNGWDVIDSVCDSVIGEHINALSKFTDWYNNRCGGEWDVVDSNGIRYFVKRR